MALVVTAARHPPGRRPPSAAGVAACRLLLRRRRYGVALVAGTWWLSLWRCPVRAPARGASHALIRPADATQPSRVTSARRADAARLLESPGCTRRDDGGLLLAATLAPILLAVRTGFYRAAGHSRPAHLADVAGTALGLLVLGALVWAGRVAGGLLRRQPVPPRRRAALPTRRRSHRLLVLFAAGA